LPKAADIVTPYLYLMSAASRGKTGRQFMAQGADDLPWAAGTGNENDQARVPTR
jgi:hypothetical protein